MHNFYQNSLVFNLNPKLSCIRNSLIAKHFFIDGISRLIDNNFSRGAIEIKCNNLIDCASAVRELLILDWHTVQIAPPWLELIEGRFSLFSSKHKLQLEKFKSHPTFLKIIAN